MPGLLGIGDDEQSGSSGLSDLYGKLAYLARFNPNTDAAIVRRPQYQGTDPGMQLQYRYPGQAPGELPPQWWGGPQREA